MTANAAAAPAVKPATRAFFVSRFPARYGEDGVTGKEKVIMVNDREDMDPEMTLVGKSCGIVYSGDTLLGLIKGPPADDVDEVVVGKKKEKLPPPFSTLFVTEAKDVVFARRNLPGMATLAASTAAAGVVATAASPAICFSFYAIFIAAMAAVAISLSGT